MLHWDSLASLLAPCVVKHLQMAPFHEQHRIVDIKGGNGATLCPFQLIMLIVVSEFKGISTWVNVPLITFWLTSASFRFDKKHTHTHQQGHNSQSLRPCAKKKKKPVGCGVCLCESEAIFMQF